MLNWLGKNGSDTLDPCLFHMTYIQCECQAHCWILSRGWSHWTWNFKWGNWDLWRWAAQSTFHRWVPSPVPAPGPSAPFWLLTAAQLWCGRGGGVGRSLPTTCGTLRRTSWEKAACKWTVSCPGTPPAAAVTSNGSLNTHRLSFPLLLTMEYVGCCEDEEFGQIVLNSCHGLGAPKMMTPMS